MLEELTRAPPLPYIPPPDYTMKKIRPVVMRSTKTIPQYSAALQSSILDSTQVPVTRNKDDPGKPHRYVPPISPPRQRPPLMEALARIESYGKNDSKCEINDHRHHLPQNTNSTMLQIEAKHQESRSKEERVKKMLQEQGVPVFPGAVLPQSSKADQNLGPTKAYIKHLENHRKYDTLNSYRSCENCQLCRQMEQEMGILSPASHERHQHAHNYNEVPHHSKTNVSQPPITSSKFFEPLVEEEPAIDANNIQTSSNEKDPYESQKSDSFPRPVVGANRSITDSRYSIEPVSSSARNSNPDRILPIITPNWTPMSERKAAPTEHSSPSMMRANTILSKSLHNVNATASQHVSKPIIGLVPTAAASALSVVVGPQLVRAKKSRKAKTPQELTISSGDILKVLESGPNWVRCLNRQGQNGWVPRKDTQPCS